MTAVEVKGLIVLSTASLSLVCQTAIPFAITMMMFIILDYITGIVKACYLKELNSKTATKGLFKKLSFILTFVTGWAIDASFNLPFSVGTIISTWIIVTEIISVFENLAGCGVAVPQFIIEYFKQAKQTIEETDTTKTESEEDKNEDNQQ